MTSPQKVKWFLSFYTILMCSDKRVELVIPPKSARPREAGGLDEGAPEILRCAQDDRQGFCHPERSEGSLVDLGGITRAEVPGRAFPPKM